MFVCLSVRLSVCHTVSVESALSCPLFAQKVGDAVQSNYQQTYPRTYVH